MRTLTRKLLSLLLAFTMVCAMVPAAMAADGEVEWKEGAWTGGKLSESHTSHTPDENPTVTPLLVQRRGPGHINVRVVMLPALIQRRL